MNKEIKVPVGFNLYVFLHLLWDFIVFGTCTYVVFWLDQSGWWYLLAIIIAGGLPSYKNYLNRDKEENDDM